ncbi:PREDICTED: janus kinase and microtubule-interacting protein 3-like, partial [Rhagoletis zephyria]|uniref:janus kinase and microtubule-interacting protein 3-like n=1 Tax=Rhagoletis zephyria TaxID=28612 RepID=UPI0008116C15
MDINNNAKLQQLMARVKQLEEQEHQLSTEADELREQNELLEFRILELEETNDKVSKVALNVRLNVGNSG